MTEKKRPLWDKQRACSCAVEVASVIGRNEEVGAMLERYKTTEGKPREEDWVILEDEVKALGGEIELAQGYCQLKLKDSKKAHKELENAIKKRNLDASLYASSGVKVSVMGEVNKCVTEEIMKGIKRKDK